MTTTSTDNWATWGPHWVRALQQRGVPQPHRLPRIIKDALTTEFPPELLATDADPQDVTAHLNDLAAAVHQHYQRAAENTSQNH